MNFIVDELLAVALPHFDLFDDHAVSLGSLGNSTRLVHVALVDFEDLLQVRVALQLLESANCLYHSFLDDAYAVCQVKEVDCVGDQYARLGLELALEDFFEDAFADVGIEG